MTGSELLAAATALPKAIPLRFTTPDGLVGDGFHVTEFKIAQIKSIDCAGRRDQWVEATLQLLDGHDEVPMQIGKFADILDRSIQTFSDLASAEIRVEFSHENRSLELFDASLPEAKDQTAQIQLTPMRARCKPATDLGCGVPGGCCG